MKLADALALTDELSALVGTAPGPAPAARGRVDAIAHQLLLEERQRPELAASLRRVQHWLDIWMSPRRWRRLGEEQVRALLANAIAEVRTAVLSGFSEE